jgi:hypothetical protein
MKTPIDHPGETDPETADEMMTMIFVAGAVIEIIGAGEMTPANGIAGGEMDLLILSPSLDGMTAVIALRTDGLRPELKR